MSSQEFNAMLNDHLYYDLLKMELMKKNYIWKVGTHDEQATGDIIVPFQSTRGTSIKAGGGPTATNDIAKHQYVRGSIAHSARPEIWMTMEFLWKDIIDHEGKVKQKTFLGKFLPDQIEDGTDFFSQSINHMFLNSAHLLTATATGTVGGVVEVDRVERAEIGMYITFDLSPDVAGYITAIDVNENKITLKDARSGGAAVDCQTVVSGTKGYQKGFETGANQITSLKDSLLSAANGGASNLYGVSKLSSPYLQAVNIDGSGVNASNILQKIFNGLVRYKTLTKVGVAEIWISMKHAGAIMTILEQDKGPYKAVPGSTKSNEYGFTEIMIFGPDTGAVKFVMLPEQDHDVIYYMDPKAFTIHSNGGIRKVKSPDGLYYYTVRDATNGYSYVCDMYFNGDVVVHKPHRCGIMYDIPDYSDPS